MEVGEPPA